MAAQGQLVAVAATAAACRQPSSTLSSLTEEAAHQLQQFQKIIQFHDAIVAGSHPKVKLPPHSLAGLAASSPQVLQAISPSHTRQSSNAQSFAANALKPAVPGLGLGLPSTAKNSGTKPFAAVTTEIDPIFLEKSDDLIRAELQLQRQRLERALREEVDQRRVALKATAQAEPLPDFDIHDVLAKAQTLVQATSASLPAAEPAANETAASESLDENSYYSSQHNSPDTSQQSSQDDRASVGSVAETSKGRPGGPPPVQGLTQGHLQASPHSLYYASAHQHQGMAPAPLASQPNAFRNAAPGSGYIPGLLPADITVTENTTAGESTSVGERSGDVSRHDSGDIMEVDHSAGRSVPTNLDQSRLRESLLARPPSPLVVAQALAPIAPQASRVSSLATPQQPAQPADRILQGTSAQVAALRNEPTVLSSPDSSPQGGRRNDRKRGKRKETKKDRKTPRQVQDIPYIKPEPQSPSPPSASQFPRPQKRQKRQAENDNMGTGSEGQPSRQHGEEYPYPAYPGSGPQAGHRPASRPLAQNGYSYAPEYIGDRRVSAGAQPYAVQYAPADPYGAASAPLPPAPLPMSIYEKEQEPQRTYHHAYEAPRMSARPEPPRALSRSPMGPPSGPPLRVVVDASGRRYYEPPPPPPSAPPVYRQSVPPPMRVDEPEILYERPVRGESRRPEYPEGGVSYRTEPPTYAAPRRIVTQPEYGVSDHHRGYREREYSSRPVHLPPAEHYFIARGPEERRPVEDITRGYAMRATTAMPAEPIRYEVPMGYERVQSLRPDLAVHGYPAPPARPGEIRREVGQPAPRAYSVRPVEPQGPQHREFSVRPPEAYYGQPVRPVEEVAYMEPPRGATHEIAYNEARREYR